ncbi:hypothetical protein KC19_9G175700 [Ceratodon purpureus]|uniref:Uncharacterized protein n=1 Tax=Ceratodon purpureus TaxID=3225 RepID=A0A8T0GWR6_CERPU|nr:hypothetical protein KC19_9G175700 [Ceratodon purpureus]
MEILNFGPVGVALIIIHKIVDMADNVCVNKRQCKRLAERCCDISQALEVLMAEQNGDTLLEADVMDEILIVLKKGEALVRSYADESSALNNVVCRGDNREAFKEVYEEIDILGTYSDLNEKEKCKLLSSDAEIDQVEIALRAQKLILGDILKGRGSIILDDFNVEGDVENMTKAVAEKCYNAESNAEDLSYLNIPFSAIHLDCPRKELKPLVERMAQANAHLDGLGLVYKGKWNNCDCAIKVFRAADIHWHTEELNKEIACLAKFRHPHITQLIGCAQYEDRTYVLFELMDTDLRFLIDSRMKKRILPKFLKDGRPFSRSEEISIITQIAKGMLFLHERGCVHGELKCSNLLVKEIGDHIDVKVADFHHTRQLGQVPAIKYKPSHRPRWMPPEIIEQYNVVQPSDDMLMQADVYTFAMTCYEVITGKYPFDGVRGKALPEKIMAGERPELPKDLDQDLKGLITKCWHANPEQRPCFQEICYVLNVRARNLTSRVGKLLSSRLGNVGNQEPVRDSLEGKVMPSIFVNLVDNSLRDLIDSRIKASWMENPFSDSEALGLITKLALGINYLHSQGVTHRDIKCANVLVRNADWKRDYLDVKIEDFGVPQRERLPFKQSEVVGRWHAPEIIGNMDSKRPVKADWFKADVYSFAMTCAEILTGKYPFDGVKGKALEKKIKAGERPQLPKDLDQGLKRLITNCWHADPKKRPSFPDIYNVLEIVANRMNLTSHVGKLFSSCLGVGNQNSVAGMGFPTRNWCAEEIHAMLKLAEEALLENEGHDLWDYVSENLWEEYGFDRSPNSCQQQWEAILQSYQAIQDHRSKLPSGSSSLLEIAEYWKLNEDERSKLRRASVLEEIRWLPAIEPSCMNADLVYPTPPDREGVQYCEVLESQTQETGAESENEGSTATTATIRHGAEILEDDVISRITPFVNKQIEDAFKPLIAVMCRHLEKVIKSKDHLL